MTEILINTYSNWEQAKDHEVQQISSPLQNFGLSKSEFDLIVVELKQGNESLFEKIFLAHFQDCTTYLKNSYKASHEIAYDIAMDTLIEFRYKLLTDKISYGNLRYLFTKMAGQLYLKSIAKENKVKESIFESIEVEDDIEDKMIALKNAWSSLSHEDKKLLENYYYLDIPLNKIAEVEYKTDSALRKQKQRAVDKLRQIFFTVYNKL